MIAARAGRDRRLAPLVLLLWPYLHRLATRFEALARRIDAGEAALRRAPTTRPPRPPRARSPGLPDGFGWLLRIALETAPLGSQIRQMLGDPDHAALLTDPRAGRILRPLCRMLGIRPSPELPSALFQPPPRPSPAAQAPAATPAPAPVADPVTDPASVARHAPAAPPRWGAPAPGPDPGSPEPPPTPPPRARPA
jgi:hypothetical protein